MTGPELKNFQAFNSTTEWSRQNIDNAKSVHNVNSLIECFPVVKDLRVKLMEAEILRDETLAEVAIRFGFPVKNYSDVKLLLKRKPFWKITNASKKHVCSGTACIRCKVCGTRSTSATAEEFIRQRARPSITEKRKNLDLTEWHRCGSNDPTEVEFTERCMLKCLPKGKLFQSYREPGTVIQASGNWFICLETGMMHYCHNGGSCSKMTLEMCDGCPVSYSCSLTGLAKSNVMESFVAWDGVHFYSASTIHRILNGIATAEATAASVMCEDEKCNPDASEEFLEEVDEADEIISKSKKKPDPVEKVENGKRTKALLEEDDAQSSKRLKLSTEYEQEEVVDANLEAEIDDLFEDSESSTEPQETKNTVENSIVNAFNDIHCFELQEFNYETLTETLHNIVQQKESEKQELESLRIQNEADEDIRTKNHTTVGMSQLFVSSSREMKNLIRRIQKGWSDYLKERKVQDQNNSEKREEISLSGVSLPFPQAGSEASWQSGFVVNERDFFAATYQMTKQEKIEDFLARGTIEKAVSFIKSMISGKLKTKLALLLAKKSADNANVYVANLLNRYQMPFMTAVSFWMDSLTSSINGPIYYEEMNVDIQYYASVIVAHWREFVMADYMEELLTERKKRKTKQMDFYLFTIGALYTMADGGVITRLSCQDACDIPELFEGTSIYQRLIRGVPVCELPDASKELGPALVSPKYLPYITEIYSRGYHFDSASITDGQTVFKLCYTYRHQRAQNILFERARQLTATSAIEREELAVCLYSDYIGSLLTPHSKAGCKKTTEA